MTRQKIDLRERTKSFALDGVRMFLAHSATAMELIFNYIRQDA